jgi:hypothetical protein
MKGVNFFDQLKEFSAVVHLGVMLQNVHLQFILLPFGPEPSVFSSTVKTLKN